MGSGKKQILSEMMGGPAEVTEDAWRDLMGTAKMIQQHGRMLEKMAAKKAVPGIEGEVQYLKDYAATAEDLLKKLT